MTIKRKEILMRKRVGFKSIKKQVELNKENNAILGKEVLEIKGLVPKGSDS